MQFKYDQGGAIYFYVILIFLDNAGAFDLVFVIFFLIFVPPSLLCPCIACLHVHWAYCHWAYSLLAVQLIWGHVFYPLHNTPTIWHSCYASMHLCWSWCPNNIDLSIFSSDPPLWLNRLILLDLQTPGVVVWVTSPYMVIKLPCHMTWAATGLVATKCHPNDQ